MKWRKIIIVTSVLVILAGLIMVNGFLDARINKLEPLRANPTGSTTSLGIGDQAPDFSLKTLDGESFRLSEKKGKTVILFGMASWCATCFQEGRVLTKIKQDYSGRGVEVIGVAFTSADSIEFLKQFRDLGKVYIPLALDTNDVAKKYSLVRLETAYIIDKNGKIAYKDEQNTSEDTYKRELEKIL